MFASIQQSSGWQASNNKGYSWNAAYSDYVVGAVDVLTKVATCPIDRVEPEKVKAIVAKFLRANPDRLDDAASLLIAEALKPHYPCPKE